MPNGYIIPHMPKAMFGMGGRTRLWNILLHIDLMYNG